MTLVSTTVVSRAVTERTVPTEATGLTVLTSGVSALTATAEATVPTVLTAETARVSATRAPVRGRAMALARVAAGHAIDVAVEVAATVAVRVNLTVLISVVRAAQKTSTPSSWLAGAAKNATDARSAATSCASMYATTSPKWQSSKVAVSSSTT